MLRKQLSNLVVKEDGQAFTEYGLILAVVAIGLTAALLAFKSQLVIVFGRLADYLGTYGAGT